jgi:putative hydrolase of the HAD superfamily
MTTSPPLRPLLLDFGGVVLLSPFELRHRIEPVLGPIDWRGPFDTSTDADWVRFQNREITERTFWAERAATYGYDDTKEFFRLFYEPAGQDLIRPEMHQLIVDYKAMGGVVGVLTNDLAAFHGVEWINGMSILAEFHFIVDGSVTGVLKPHPDSFGFALAEFGHPDPASVVFVDDQPINLEGSTAAGLDSVWFDFTDVPTSIARIHDALGGLMGSTTC